MQLKIEKNKYSTAELALLGIFALGLLFSFLLVSSRKKIQFSAPVIAPFDGIEVSMPLGRGWQSHEKWQYSNSGNAFVLQSVLQQSSIGIAQVSWQYYFAAVEKDIEEVINNISSAGGFTKVTPGNTKIGELDFTTLVFASPGGIEDYYYASCKLPFGRELKLEVKTAGDAELAGRVFEAAIKKLKYTEDQRLAAGNAFMEKVKAIGAVALLERETAGTFNRVYLVNKTDLKNTPGSHSDIDGYTGFTVEMFLRGNDLSAPGSVNASSLYFIGDDNGWTGSSIFECDKSIGKFLWQTKQSSLDNRMRTSVVIEYTDGVLRSFDPQGQVDPSKKERVFTPSSLFLPEVFMDSAAAIFFDSGQDNVLVDLILPDGRIVPVEISKVIPTENLLAVNADTAVRFTLYNSGENYYEILFDNNGNIVGKTEKTRRVFELKKTDIKDVIGQFGQYKDDLEEMLKKS